MTSMTPSGKTTIQIEGLGTVEGWEYPNGVRQFTGIQYATLAKRWTRSQLKTSWPTGHHDGTKLGASAPNPPEYNDLTKDYLTPVPHIEHFNFPEEDEFNCLVMNICLPPSSIEGPHPVMCYIHGGSLLFGGANRSIFDGVNVCNFAFERGTPVITVNFNYRVGLGGFLASEAIRRDLVADGYEGVGNFGLTDQQTALEWIQRYIPHVGGDKNNVMIYGESAGGMSVAHQCAANTPAVFHRAISMSGTLNTIPSWTLQHHEKHYRALLTYLKIDPNATDSLEQLRRVPQDEVAAATLNVEGVFAATGNACLDGVFHAIPPAFDNISSPPAWLKGFMIGDVLDEAMIMRDNVSQDDISVFRDGMRGFLSDEDTETILQLYEISDQTPAEEVRLRFEDMFGDAIFKVQNYLTAHRSAIPQTYAYHFDQLSTLENPLKGLAYHAHDLLFIWLNLREKMTEGQLALAHKMAGAWIDFAHGKDPWERFGVAKRWMIFGPDDKWGEKTEDEDESVRRYARSQKILDMGVYQAFMHAMDHIGVKRHRMGTFEWNL